MKLYHDPVSTTSRPVLLFLAEHELSVEEVQLNILAGEHLGDAFAAVNPNRMVPALVDGELAIGEASAILKYLADVAGSPAYPTDRKARARVDAAMDWINTQLSRELGYHYVYPRLFPNHAYDDPSVQAAVTSRGRANAERWLGVLDNDMLGDHPFICGAQISVADYLAAGPLGLADGAGFDFAAWPRVSAWLDRMKARPAWDPVHAAFRGLVAALRGVPQPA